MYISNTFYTKGWMHEYKKIVSYKGVIYVCKKTGFIQRFELMYKRKLFLYYTCNILE